MNHKDIRNDLRARLSAFLESNDFTSLPKQPREFQLETLHAMEKWLGDEDGSQRAFVSHATGLGKTFLFSLLLRICAGLRSLVIVPTKVLVVQTARAVAEVTGGIVGHISSLGTIRNEAGDVVAVPGHEYQDIVITTDASLKRDGYKVVREFNPHLILRDECHWSYTKKAQGALACAPEAAIVGFSATPDYISSARKRGHVSVKLENGQVLFGNPARFAKEHFAHLLDNRTLRWGIENRFLAPLAWGRINFDISLDDIPLVEGAAGLDYDKNQLQRLMTLHWPVMVETVVRLYRSGAYNLPSRQVFAVCPGVPEAEQLAQALNEIGVSSACVTGKTTDDERCEILAKYRRNEIQFISSVMVLREGWDAPNAEVCMMLRPTRSRLFYEQCIGRTLRLDEDSPNKVALILDALFQRTQFSPLSAPMLYANPGEKVKLDDILVGPRTGGNPTRVIESSPFLAPQVVPTIYVVPDLGENTEHVADDDGGFYLGEEVYAPAQVYADAWGVTPQTITYHAEGIPFIMARDRAGNLSKFYPKSLLSNACAHLMGPRAKEDEDFFEVNGMRYWAVSAIARFLGVSDACIRYRFRKIRGVYGRSARGDWFWHFSTADIVNCCSDLLKQKQMREGGQEQTL